MIAVVGSVGTCGGLTADQDRVLTSRAAEFAAFVNGGGGLFSMVQGSSTLAGDKWGFIRGSGAIATTSFNFYFNIDPTADGLAVGINDTLDGPHWHVTFTKFPDFLKPLAYRRGTLNSAAIGRARVILPVTPGGEFPKHPPPPPPPPPGLLDSVTALVNPGPSPTPSPTPSPIPDPSPTAARDASADPTSPPDGSTGPVPTGGVAAGAGGTASGSGGRRPAIMLVFLAAVAHAVVFVKRKAKRVSLPSFVRSPVV